MVEEAVEMFVRMENWDGLAVIFAQLPSGELISSSISATYVLHSAST